MLTCRSAIALISLAVTSNAFWWGNNREIEPQPVIKQVPVGYFRTYTYQPMAFNPQTPNHYFSYQAASTVKTFPQSPQKTVIQQFGLTAPSTAQSPLTFSTATSSQITNKLGSASTNVAPSIQQPPEVQPQTQQQSYQQIDQQPAAITSNINPPINAEILSNTHQSSSVHEDFRPQHTSLPSSSSSSTTNQHHQFRQYQLPEQQLNLQYYAANVAPPAPVPQMQQIQFVPCMCPISLTLPPEMTFNKRIDELPLPVASVDAKDGVETFEEK